MATILFVNRTKQELPQFDLAVLKQILGANVLDLTMLPDNSGRALITDKYAKRKVLPMNALATDLMWPFWVSGIAILLEPSEV